MRQPKIALLFGAGASHGAGAVEPFPPPLGRDFYRALKSNFPETWGALRDDEVAAFGKEGTDFESGMKLLWEKFDERASPALIDVAIYFSRFRPPRDQSDCYSRLMIALRALGLIDHVRIATLNYECLLEIASTRAGVMLNYSGRLIPGELALAKPHGSCNFLVDMNVQNVTIIGSREMQNLVMGDPYIETDLDAIEPKFRSGYSIPPIMSMYADGKHTPVNKGLVAEMRDDWRKWAEEADVVAVVGAQPYFRDAHIWDPVRASNAAVWYIGGTGGQFDDLTRELGDRLDRLGRDFGNSLRDLLQRFGELAPEG